MSNVLFRRIGIRRNIKNLVLHIKKEFKFYINVIDEFLQNEFINNKNKKYLNETKRNILKSQKKIILKK